jgi:hypothetical protein
VVGSARRVLKTPTVVRWNVCQFLPSFTMTCWPSLVIQAGSSPAALFSSRTFSGLWWSVLCHPLVHLLSCVPCAAMDCVVRRGGAIYAMPVPHGARSPLSAMT